MTESYLIRGACVLTLGNRTQNHASTDVLVRDGVVAEIASGIRERGVEVIEGRDTIVMPGFVDAHRRCWTALFKNEGADGKVPELGVPSPDQVYAGTLLSLLGAIEAGITTVVDWYDGPETADHIDASIRAHSEAGIRTVLVLATGSDRVAVWRATAERHGIDPTPTMKLAAGSPPIGEMDTDAISTAWAAARQLGLRIHAVAGPGEAGRIAALNNAGLLGSDVTIAHVTGLSDSDLDAIGSSDTGVALTPSSDMTTGPGTPPMQDLLDRGINPGLGVDHEFVGPGDVLAQMRAAISIQHARYFDLKLSGKGGLPNLLTTRDVIKYGTSAGANAVGLGALTGSIEVGKRADLIVLRTDKPNIYPINDPIGAVVWGVDTSNLDWVLADGTAVMREGRMTADIDAAKRVIATALGGEGQLVGGMAIGDGS